MTIKTAILNLIPVPRKVPRPDWSDVDPGDIDPETGAPYEGYSSQSIEPHPFGAGIWAGIIEP